MRHQRQLAELVRSPKLEEVGLEALRDDEGRTTDEHFLRLYQRYSLGKLPSILTRVSMERIHPGVFSRAANGNVLHFDFESDPKHVEWMSYDIRRGFRPPLYLYRGIFGKTIGAFVCSDDVAAYCAYRKLGIRQVPALILGRSADMLEESGICLRIQGGKTVFDSVIAAKRTRAATLFGDNSRLNKLSPIAAIKRLRLEADRAAAGIRAFHIESDSADEIHYHHCLHSIALRLSEVLQAVELLLRNNLAYQMRPLIRSTYELFLNFYIDWLSPEHVGLLLQGMAVLSRTEKARSDHQQLKQSMETRIDGRLSQCK